MSRRLAAILVADTVGYSRLMGMDEVGTLGRLGDIRAEIVDPAIATGGGRIFKSMGDALLIEFASAVHAVTCALTLVERMEAVKRDDPLRFRFGLHVGDVIEQDGDLFGDTVNIAARVESEAEPGGVVLTEDAARYVRGKIGRELEDLGERRLKNIAAPVRLFAIGPARARTTRANTSPGHLPTLKLEALRQLGDPSQGSITEGLDAGLASALACFRFFDLIDAGGPADFAFGGSAHVAGTRVRVTVNLTERTSGRRIWGATYDRSTEDPFTMYDDLLATIASTLGEAIPEEAARGLASKPAADWTAFDYIVDGARNLHRLDPEGCRLSRDALLKALAIEPSNDVARLVLAWVNFVEHRWSPERAKIDDAMLIVRDLLRQNERDDGAWRLLSRLSTSLGRTDEALAYARRAREINPYESDHMVCEGTTLVCLGRPEEGMPLIERAIRINPYAPGYYKAELALARLLSGDPDGALLALRDLARPVLYSRLTAAVAQVELGRHDEARRLVNEHLAEYPDATAQHSVPALQDPNRERYQEALIEAGMPAS